MPSEQSWVKNINKKKYKMCPSALEMYNMYSVIHQPFKVKCKINIFSSEKSQVPGKTLHGGEKVCAVVHLCCLTFLFASDLSQRCLARGLATE